MTSKLDPRRQPLGEGGPLLPPSPHANHASRLLPGTNTGAGGESPSSSSLGEDLNQRDVDSDFDEAYSDSTADGEVMIGDDTKTLSTYITRYRYENGRRYHSYRDGAYWVSGAAAALLLTCLTWRSCYLLK